MRLSLTHLQILTAAYWALMGWVLASSLTEALLFCIAFFSNSAVIFLERIYSMLKEYD